MLNRISFKEGKAEGWRSLQNRHQEFKSFYLLARDLGRWRLFQKCTKIFLLDLVQIQSHPGTAGKKNKQINKLIKINDGDLINMAMDTKQHTEPKSSFLSRLLVLRAFRIVAYVNTLKA